MYKKITIELDNNCSLCKKALKLFDDFQKKRFSDYYGSMNMKTNKFIKGFVLKPDFNCTGILTHYHLNIEK